MNIDHLLNPETEKKHKRKSAISVGIFFILLLILSFLLGFRPGEKEMGKEGIWINFGTTVEGSGREAPNTQEVSTPPTETASAPEAETEVNPVADVNAIAIETKTETQKEEKKVEEEKEEQPEPAEKPEPPTPEPPRHVFSGAPSTSDNTSTSSGDNVNLGHAGEPTGRPNSPGDAQGDAFQLGGDLSGRGWRIRPDEDAIQHNLPRTERLVFNIEVQTDGTVRVTGQGRGNEVTNTQILDMIRREIESAKVNPGSSTTRGTVTFVLKPR